MTAEILAVYKRLAKSDATECFDEILVLDHLQREKGRIRACSVNGTEVRIFLDRGNTLSIGEILHSTSGHRIIVQGAKESVVTASTTDWQQFSRACYHLGNRHVKMQIGDRWLRILADQVLETMLLQLGVNLLPEQAVFVPEPGAYKHAH